MRRNNTQNTSVTYVLGRKIFKALVLIFVVSFLLILGVSFIFFFVFMDSTLDVSVESIFYAHTYQTMRDIIKLKKNDFILSQNELRVAGPVIVDIIERKNFNASYLLGPNNDLEPFYRVGGPLKNDLIYTIANDGLPEDSSYNRTRWYAGTKDYDEEQLDKQIINRLHQRDIDEGYTDFSTAEVDDIITCIGSLFVRSDLSMNFRYTDLDKFINYIGFETGVWCVYPNYWSPGLLLDGEEGEAKYKCMQNQFFRDTYLNGS